PYSWGTAVNVQMMAFGNMGDDCGTGVAFTRNPATGEKGLMGEFLMNAQGEDVVAGVRTPMPISKMAEVLPDVYKQFQDVCKTLENHYRDMQDMEFTIEKGKLYMLQTRNGKRTAAAAIRIACDLIDEKMITEEEALLQIDAKTLDMLLHPTFDSSDLKAADKDNVVGKAIAASPGAAAGTVVFTPEDAVKEGKAGKKVVLVRLETSPEDIEGMKFAQGILTVRGGQTSHAAVVARGMGTCCVSGCGEIEMHEEEKYFILAGKKFVEGSEISLDGTTGKIYDRIIKTVPADPNSGYFGRIMKLSDKYKRMAVRTNADTPKDAAKAMELGAQGIGLCRTEHMFFDPARIGAFREMICSDTLEERENALAKILPMQQKDFEELYKACKGYAVTIRYLDPPLHEFVPTEEADIAALAKTQGKSVEQIKAIIDSLHEFNPMMGHRGLRLAVTYPEIAKMQTRAVIRAAINVNKECGYKIVPEIMIPLSCDAKELKFVKDIVVKVADEEIKNANAKLEYKVGTMIEIPRAALTADEIAKQADFFCFGTNDLTQMTFGFSRDDSGKFLSAYYKEKIFEQDPFARLDQNGVGSLMKLAIKLGKPENKDLHFGICGEHGGDPSSIEFCNAIGLDYVSCSPFRVPIARLAAAQAAIKEKQANPINKIKNIFKK
nr:pyruvate, phosphate dikinase [bacterium]